jgi:hypothetical protein
MKFWIIILLIVMSVSTKNPLPSANRPTPVNRKFNSKIIEEVIEEVKTVLDDPVLALMFE